MLYLENYIHIKYYSIKMFVLVSKLKAPIQESYFTNLITVLALDIRNTNFPDRGKIVNLRMP